ncbi:MAG: DNA-binding protein [Candidatus Heimdallarchaeota archaeon]
MSDDSELEKIRAKKLQELQQQALEEQRREQLKAEIEAQKNTILSQILTTEARQRLANVKMIRPELAESIELQLIQLAQSGRLNSKVTDQQLKRTLKQISQRKREGKISFR